MVANSINDISPYGSYLVARKTNPQTNWSGIRGLVRRKVAEIVQDGGSQYSFGKNLGRVTTANAAEITAFRYIEDCPASWDSSKAPMFDVINRFVVVATNANLIAICFSDGILKSNIWRALKAGDFPGLEPIAEDILIAALISGRPLRTLWLNGTHRVVSIKADSKIISGKDLRDALDPMGDSTYLPGAVRGEKAGVSLRRSGVWMGPNKNMTAFGLQIDTLFGSINAVPAGANSQPLHSALASPVSSLNGVAGAYHVEFMSPDATESNSLKRAAERLGEKFDIGLSQNGTPLPNPYSFYVDISWQEDAAQKLCTLIIHPFLQSVRNKGEINFTVTMASGDTPDDLIEDITRSPELIRIFYDTGHAISFATLSLSHTQDRPFLGWSWRDFSIPTVQNGTKAFNIRKEKPSGRPPNLSLLWTDPNEDSLFSWVIRFGLAQLGLKAPNAAGSCFLYCDDNAMEVADFVHIDAPGNAVPCITLIHIKGAASGKATRRPVVGPYELVVAQAIKNLRYIDAKSLIERIVSRINSAANSRIISQPYGNGPQPGGQQAVLISLLNSIPANCNYKVVLIQPHALRSKTIPAGQLPPTDLGAVQLRSLLFGLESLARAVSATLVVVGDDR